MFGWGLPYSSGTQAVSVPVPTFSPSRVALGSLVAAATLTLSASAQQTPALTFYLFIGLPTLGNMNSIVGHHEFLDVSTHEVCLKHREIFIQRRTEGGIAHAGILSDGIILAAIKKQEHIAVLNGQEIHVVWGHA